MISDPYDDEQVTCADCNSPEVSITILRYNPRIGMKDRIVICSTCADRQGLTDDPTDDGDAKLDAERDGGEAA